MENYAISVLIVIKHLNISTNKSAVSIFMNDKKKKQLN